MKYATSRYVLIKKRHYSSVDVDPYDDNPCIDDQGHSVVWNDEVVSSERLDRCVACGLTVMRRGEESTVEGYIICDIVSDSMEGAKQHGENRANQLIESVRPEVAELCKSLGVARLDLFGSMATGRAGPDSDVDVLVEFIDGKYRLLGEYMDLKWGLERIFDRDGDVVVERAIKNPYFKQSVEVTRRNIYAR